MGKVKIKRKSTLIDMTAMSDVTVLLLTFFMLTSTFLQKEPVTVITPSSVSEEKVPMSDVATILVSPEGKVFMSIAGDADDETKDEFGSEAMRAKVLRAAAAEYEKVTGQSTGITEDDVAKFSKVAMFGVPLANMHEFFQLTQVQQDQFLSNMENPQVGIPMTHLPKGVKGRSDNEFQIWVQAIYGAGCDNLHKAINDGTGLAVKADQDTPYSTVHTVLDNLQDMRMNKFTVMTALKTEQD